MKKNKHYICPFCLKEFYVSNKETHRYFYSKILFCSYNCLTGYTKMINKAKDLGLDFNLKGNKNG